jgi:hypothetical protein
VHLSALSLVISSSPQFSCAFDAIIHWNTGRSRADLGRRFRLGNYTPVQPEQAFGRQAII